MVFVIVAFAVIGFYIAHKVKQAANNPVYAMAKLAVAANPDLETVSSDDSAGTITIHDRKTGKTGTLKFDAARKTMVMVDENGKTTSMRFDPDKKQLIMSDDRGKTATITADEKAGNIEIKGPDGTVKMGATAEKAPDWVPVYPGSTPQGTFAVSDDKNATGTYVFSTKDTVDKVLGYYGDSLKGAGFKISTTTSNSDGKVSGVVRGSTEGDARIVIVTAGSDDTDGTKVSVSYSNKK
jgi:hypothetical protein